MSNSLFVNVLGATLSVGLFIISGKKSAHTQCLIDRQFSTHQLHSDYYDRSPLFLSLQVDKSFVQFGKILGTIGFVGCLYAIYQIMDKKAKETSSNIYRFLLH